MDAEKNNKKKEKSYKVTKYSRETEIGPHNADFGPYSNIWLKLGTRTLPPDPPPPELGL